MKRRPLDKLLSQHKELNAVMERFDTKNEAVSSATIGWHVEHCLLIINGVIGMLNTSEPSKRKRKFNFTKAYIFILGRFPRGKVRAPKAVRPQENLSSEEVQAHLDRTISGIDSLSSMSEEVYFTHPFFGDLGLRDTIYFLEMHTEHHLKIVREVLVKK